MAPHFYLSVFNTVITVIKIGTHEEFLVSFISVSFVIIDGNCLYNSCLLIYFPIVGEHLIIASHKHEISFKWTLVSWNWYKGRKYISSWFPFSSIFFVLVVSYFYPIFSLLNSNYFFHIDSLFLCTI